MQAPIPILRIFDAALARAFYVDFLGFRIDWEHRFDEAMPRYLQVSRGTCVLHLSEHPGDASPGGHLRIAVPDLDAYVDQLRAADHPRCRPGKPRLQPWGLREVTLTDPFSNRLTLTAEPEAGTA
jgi:catechol 2,3-dioxygenase-like lactoylglutathione lyase family enzyme